MPRVSGLAERDAEESPVAKGLNCNDRPDTSQHQAGLVASDKLRNSVCLDDFCGWEKGSCGILGKAQGNRMYAAALGDLKG